MEVMDRDPRSLILYTANESDPADDDLYGTVATLAICATETGLFEVALRQDLRDEWMENCDRYNLRVPCAYVFHARYLN